MLYTLYNTCANWDSKDVYCIGGLVDLIDQCTSITRTTFLSKVDRVELHQLEQELGYSAHYKQGLTMAADWSVKYFKSKYHNEIIYGFQWSGIEYVFRSN